MNARFALFALSVGAFCIGTTEFAPMGLLPIIANDLHVSIPTAGLLITAYAAGVMAGSPLVTISLRHVPRHVLLVGMMAIFTIGNLCASLSPNYAVLMAARLITSLAHGTFFGVGAVVAASLVPAEKRASALASMFMGLTIATIGGVPLATWIGQALGWRTAFAGMTGLGLTAMLTLWLALPKMKPESDVEITREIRVVFSQPVQLALLTTSLGAGAMFTLMTYIAPVLQKQAQASDDFITMMLILVGIGFTVGNIVGGKLADRSLTGSLILFLVSLTAIMLVYPFAMASTVGISLLTFLWGVASFAIVPPLQMRVMTTASGAPNLASSVNISAFNLGNALGALAGAGVIDAGFSYAWVAPAGGVIALAALLIVLAGRRAMTA